MPKSNSKMPMQPVVVLVYTLLYINRLGLVIHPMPLGALTPNECLMKRAGDVLADIRFVIEGIRKPNFI